jgi:hypothetical protein
MPLPPSTVPDQIYSPADRVQRLKDARTEAAKEIEEYKKSKEAEFKAFEQSVCLAPLSLVVTLTLTSDVACRLCFRSSGQSG